MYIIRTEMLYGEKKIAGIERQTAVKNLHKFSGSREKTRTGLGTGDAMQREILFFPNF